MTRRCTPLPTCPDCGGLLQPVEPERLTSTEVASSDRRDDEHGTRRQCLICGYQEAAVPAASSASAPT
jgi:hypothetical protein